jgi:putative ABC transport system substrate-binding protein
MPASLVLDEHISLKELAGKYELSGAAILNAVHFAMLQTFANDRTSIDQSALLDGITSSLTKMTNERVGAFVVITSPVLSENRERILNFAVKNRLPATYPNESWVESGGLMTYGTNLADLWRRAAIFVDKIVKGAKPTDLPVEQPLKFDFLINLKAAKQIGLTIPPNVLARADRVIR